MWTIVVSLNKRGLLMEKTPFFTSNFQKAIFNERIAFSHILSHRTPNTIPSIWPSVEKRVILWVRYSASFDLSNRMAVPVLYVNPLQFSHINSHKTIPVCCFSSRKAFSRYWSILAYFYFIDLWNYVVDRKLVNLCLIFFTEKSILATKIHTSRKPDQSLPYLQKTGPR